MFRTAYPVAREPRTFTTEPRFWTASGKAVTVFDYGGQY